MLFLLNIIPGWLLSALFFLGIVLALASKFFPVNIRIPIFWAAIVTIFLTTYLSGAKYVNDSWQLKVKELELKVSELEIKSEKINTEVITKVITKEKEIRGKTQEIIKYVDKEVVKYDNSCVIPQEVLEAHNKAIK